VEVLRVASMMTWVGGGSCMLHIMLLRRISRCERF